MSTCTCAYALVYVVTCGNPHTSVFCISTCTCTCAYVLCMLLHVDIHTLQYFVSVHVYMCVYVGVCRTSVFSINVHVRALLVHVVHALTCMCIVLAHALT